MIHFICALKCEAQPLLEHFALKHQTAAKLFSSYLDDTHTVSLTVTGVGKLNAAAGTMHAISYFKVERNDVWLNVGIAGHKTLDIGEAFLANSIRDVSTNKVWHPQITFASPVPAMGLLTLDQASFDYNELLFDMESSGFYSSAISITTSEFCHCFKIISDNKNQHSDKLEKSFVSGLVKNKLPELTGIIDALREIAEERKYD